MSPLVHVDRKSLYTSLEARIDYLHRFLDWDERDIEALAYGSSHIRDLIPAVVYIIYHKLSQFDITAHAFEDRNTSLESPSKDQPSSESSLLLQRQSFLNSYLTRLSSDQSSMAFWEYLDCIGAMHLSECVYSVHWLNQCIRVVFVFSLTAKRLQYGTAQPQEELSLSLNTETRNSGLSKDEGPLRSISSQHESTLEAKTKGIPARHQLIGEALTDSSRSGSGVELMGL
ncbi:hypothetical protein CEP53_014863 [Fusarium sp. AF-6]|nr:hypothetical protein CEP53_014863 [Fusarium sp. AF-6]